MRIHVLDEFVSRKSLSIVSVALGSLLLASCSSSSTRFDFPTFGLAKSEGGQSNGFTLNGTARLGQSNSGGYVGGGSESAAFDRRRNPDLALRDDESGQARSSYMPPQSALPEVRGARYASVERQPLARGDVYAPRSETVAAARDYAPAPMQPISEPSRSFLPEEPSGFEYEAARPADPVPARTAKPSAAAAKTVQKTKPIRQASLEMDKVRSVAQPKRSVSAAAKKLPADVAPSADLADMATPEEVGVASQAAESGEVVAQPGETLFAIGQRNGASLVEMMELNGLTDSNITAGQRLRVPARKSNTTVAARRPAAATGKGSKNVAAGNTYTVKSGESFQDIAASVGVDAAELADLNGVTDTAAIRPGEVLILPARTAPAEKGGGMTVTRQPSKSAEAEAAVAEGDDDRAPSAGSEQGDAKVRKVKTVKMASLPKSTIDDVAGGEDAESLSAAEVDEEIRPTAGKANAAGKIRGFRWPVEGRIIEKFGARNDGTHNDGINLAVPNGTKVKAAEDGVVAYAGNELKDYGNLVLIRHADGWVSAYGHNDEILVRRGDQVKRGQDIARAGNSGSVEQPQVHFELRRGSRPVDPIQHMAGS